MSKKKSQTTNWKEQRRFHALKLKRKSWKQREIATALNVSEGAISRWLKSVKDKGKKVYALIRIPDDRLNSPTQRNARFLAFLGMVRKHMVFAVPCGLVPESGK